MGVLAQWLLHYVPSYGPAVPTLHAKLSDAAKREWAAFSSSRRVSMTALAEVIGRRGFENLFSKRLLDELVAEAQDVDWERDHPNG